MLLLAACGTPVSTPLPVLPPTLPFTPESDIYAQNLRLFDYDTSAAVEFTEVSSHQEDGYTLHDIHYPSPRLGEVPAYLLVPEGNGPFAGVLLMHGSSGSRESLLDFAKDLVLTGAVVMTISGPAARIPGREWLTFTSQDREEQIQLMLDLRRAVDLLIQHEKVDSSRIGYVGYSYGAAMGGLLAGIEHRIKAYGLMVVDGGLVTHFTEEGQPVGGLETIDASAQERWLQAMKPIEPIHFVSHAFPSTLFFQNARYDTLVTKADAQAYQSAASEPKRTAWYDSGHGLPRQAYVDMVGWLTEQIGIDSTKFRQSN
jgi:dienelactone hydrolase